MTLNKLVQVYRLKFWNLVFKYGKVEKMNNANIRKIKCIYNICIQNFIYLFIDIRSFHFKKTERKNFSKLRNCIKKR